MGARTIAVCLAVALAGCGGAGREGERPAAGGPVEGDLHADYENEPAGDAKYLGKVVRRKGEPVKTWKDGDAYVVGFTTQDDLYPTVHFRLRPSAAGEAAGAKGVITIEGVCEGRAPDPRSYTGYVVRVRDAALVTRPGR